MLYEFVCVCEVSYTCILLKICYMLHVDCLFSYSSVQKNWLVQLFTIWFVYTPLWVILVSQNLTCSNVYYMFRVYCLMNYNFDVLHSSGALHCNINLWLVCLCIWCIIYIRIIQVAKYVTAIFVHVCIITYVSYTSFL